MRHATGMTIDFHMLAHPDGLLPAVVRAMPVQDDMAAHDHLFHEIMLVDAGQATHVTVAGRQRLRPGDVFVIQPQVWHAFADTRRFAVTNLLIAPSLIRRYQDDLAVVGGAFELFRRRPRRPWLRPPIALHATPAQLNAIRQPMQAIGREQHDQADGWRAAIAAYALQVLVATARLARCSTAGAVAGESEMLDHTMQDALTYLETHYQRQVSLEELADHCALSPYHLSRLFNQRVGMGINAYIHRLRAEEACRQLRASDAPISTVAARVGYDDVAYFSRCFRQQTGTSPRDYRRAGNDA